jgi:hypothetical protein
MKPIGKMFVVQAVLSIVCAVGLFSAVANAATVHGTFKLPVEARWGRMVLEPGEYEFSVDTASAGQIIVIHSKDSSWSGMVMPTGISDFTTASDSSLALGSSDEGEYVRTLYLSDAGVALSFAMPKTAALTKVAKSSKTATMASAAGAQ